MKYKINIWIYGIAALAALTNAWFAYKSGDIKSTGIWLICMGLACGATGAYLELRDKNGDGE